jgi:hypothetical protein
MHTCPARGFDAAVRRSAGGSQKSLRSQSLQSTSRPKLTFSHILWGMLFAPAQPWPTMVSSSFQSGRLNIVPNEQMDRIERRVGQVETNVSELKSGQNELRADVHHLGLQFEEQRETMKLCAERLVALDEKMEARFAQLRLDLQAQMAPLTQAVIHHSRLLERLGLE